MICTVAAARSSTARPVRSSWWVIVVGHPEATEIANDPRRFSSAVSEHLQPPNGFDGPEHTAFRSLIDTYLSAAEVERFTADFRAMARETVAEAMAAGTTDAVTELGARYAVRAMMAWLSWSAYLEDRLLDWVAANVARRPVRRSGEAGRGCGGLRRDYRGGG